MSVTVEIEVSDEDAAWMRGNRPMFSVVNHTGRVLGAVADALPKPIQVGDTVKDKHGVTYEVAGVRGGWAWVWLGRDDGFDTILVDALEVVR